MSKDKPTFNPSDHFENIKGKDYLPVQWRIVWLREDHPDWSIETEITDYRADKQAMAKATIKDETGRIIATAHKTAKPRGMISDYVELAETGSIGRALAYCGYGTQFAPDIEEDENSVVDSPTKSKDAIQGNTEAVRGIKSYISTVPGAAKSRQYFALASEVGYDGETAKDAVKKQFKLSSYTEVEAKQLDAMINAMKKRKEKMNEHNVDIDSLVDELQEEGIM